MSPRITLATLLLIPLFAARLAAQKVLMADNAGKLTWVQAVRGSDPCVNVDGTVKPIVTQGFVLKDVPEFLPMFVSVKFIKASANYVTSLNGVGDLNNDFRFTAIIQSSYTLKNVFIVLDLTTEKGDRSIFLSEVGDLDANTSKDISAGGPTASKMGKGKYYLHIFSEGIEVLQSTIPFDVREAVLDRMVAKRIKDVHSQAPKLFVVASPDYPDSLKDANLKGLVKVAFRIGPNGAVYNPVVKSATDPAFGDAALAAVRLWRFLPAVRDDAAVGMDVVVPVVFDQPKPTKA